MPLDTPLHKACNDGDLSEVLELLNPTDGSPPADPNAPGANNRTPLHRAAGSGSEPVVAALISAGADLRAKDSSNRTVLHYAAAAGHVHILEKLLQRDIDVGAASTNGLTALHLAASQGHDEIVNMLLATGRIDATARDSEDKTAADLARENNHKALAKALEKWIKMVADGYILVQTPQSGLLVTNTPVDMDSSARLTGSSAGTLTKSRIRDFWKQRAEESETRARSISPSRGKLTSVRK
eukprot:TRINITY_DN1056_c0_g1_i1.p1 TRINITY_DN1056_c0_g1~~TRINITY_DN1056_c0_g1_i1.p1  ORF type:complete len:253 (+),score=37.39 TRINITY_DN1056_c0_g1_i1:42-761(+)